MNNTSPYNYGPQNYDKINAKFDTIESEITDIAESIGDPDNPIEGSIYSDINNIEEIIGNPNNPEEGTIFSDINEINTAITNINNEIGNEQNPEEGSIWYTLANLFDTVYNITCDNHSIPGQSKGSVNVDRITFENNNYMITICRIYWSSNQDNNTTTYNFTVPANVIRLEDSNFFLYPKYLCWVIGNTVTNVNGRYYTTEYFSNDELNINIILDSASTSTTEGYCTTFAIKKKVAD